MENKIKHLEMIERIIERMEKNSFSLKGWVVTLVVAICALSVNGSEKRFILVALVPILVFWLMDSFYLQLERKYRILYQDVIKKNEDQINFSMELNAPIISGDEKDKICFCKCLFSFSEILFYLPLTLSIVFIIYYLKLF